VPWGVLSSGGPDLVTFGDALLACHAAIYRYARALSRDPVTADELVQEAYRKALAARRFPHPPTEENLRPWLFTIVRNHWHNERRRQKREADSGEEPVHEETPEVVLHRRYLQSEVRDAIDSLPESSREVIVLREMENLSYAEIAALLDCPVGTVMSRLARARTLLRNRLARIAPPKGVASR
jgi:RNA polymerase sigma-70 factor (ECF subfamily)